MAGWHPFRRRPIPESVPIGHPAAKILSQLAGLQIGRCGRGIDGATSDIVFEYVDDHPDIPLWNQRLDTILIGIGLYCHSHGELYLDAAGRCYAASGIDDSFWFLGGTFAEAVENLLLGRRARPLLRPGQHPVMLYGEECTIDHPAVYR